MAAVQLVAMAPRLVAMAQLLWVEGIPLHLWLVYVPLVLLCLVVAPLVEHGLVVAPLVVLCLVVAPLVEHAPAAC